MHSARYGKRWALRKAPWLIVWTVWSALWLAWLIVAGGPVWPAGVAVFGFIVLGAFWLGTRQEGKIKDWEQRKREAEVLEGLERDALESKQFEREAAELERKDRHD